MKGMTEKNLDEAFDKFGQALERARDEYEDVKESEQVLDGIVPSIAKPETT
jgi:hypothetical protein